MHSLSAAILLSLAAVTAIAAPISHHKQPREFWDISGFDEPSPPIAPTKVIIYEDKVTGMVESSDVSFNVSHADDPSSRLYIRPHRSMSWGCSGGRTGEYDEPPLELRSSA